MAPKNPAPTPRGDNQASTTEPTPSLDAIREADAPVVNNPSEGAVDMKTLPVFEPKPLPASTARVRATSTTLSGCVRKDF